MRVVGTIALLVALAATTAVSVVALPFFGDDPGSPALPLLTVALWGLFAAAAWCLFGVRGRAGVVLVLVGTAVIGAAALAGPPNTSTDSARYAWDGIVQNAGISPYDYVPADPALRDLRTEWLFPEPTIDADGEPRCPGTKIMRFEELDTGEVVCSAINRLPVPTIYPPLAELTFAGVRALVPATAEFWPMQVLGLLGMLGVTALLLVLLRRRGLDPRWAALWGWCPLVATEAVTNSHIDILGALLLVVATGLVASGRRWRGGIALGAAIGTKLIPVIGAPALLRGRPVPVIVAAVVTFAALYVPYVIASGIEVVGYLPGYLSEEGYGTGDRFVLLSPYLPGLSALVVAGILLLVVAVLVWRLSDPTDPWLGQLVMIGATLAIVTPRYPWYALLLVPMVVMTRRWEWLAIPAALTVRLLIHGAQPVRLAMVVAIVVVVIVSVRRADPQTRALWKSLVRRPIATLFPRRSEVTQK
jgi:hypothetical protein